MRILYTDEITFYVNDSYLNAAQVSDTNPLIVDIGGGIQSRFSVEILLEASCKFCITKFI